MQQLPKIGFRVPECVGEEGLHGQSFQAAKANGFAGGALPFLGGVFFPSGKSAE
jgi:hypothetical protein